MHKKSNNEEFDEEDEQWAKENERWVKEKISQVKGHIEDLMEIGISKEAALLKGYELAVEIYLEESRSPVRARNNAAYLLKYVVQE